MDLPFGPQHIYVGLWLLQLTKSVKKHPSEESLYMLNVVDIGIQRHTGAVELVV